MSEHLDPLRQTASPAFRQAGQPTVPEDASVVVVVVAAVAAVVEQVNVEQ